MKKHILRIIVTVLILSVISGGVWFFFFKPGDDSVIYNDLVALSKTIDTKNESINKLSNADSINGSRKLSSFTDFNEVNLIRAIITEGSISEFKNQTTVNEKLENQYKSLFTNPQVFSDGQIKKIQLDANFDYAYDLFLNNVIFSEINSYSLNYLTNTLDEAYKYYVLLSKTASGVNKKNQDVIKNAISKYESALRSCTNTINEIISYQSLINEADVVVGNAKVYTLTRTYGDLKNNFMTMFNNYIDLIVKVKNYDVKHVFNNNFVHDKRTAFYESVLYAVNNMAIRPSEAIATQTGSIVNIDKAWYNAFYDACVIVNTKSANNKKNTITKDEIINILKTHYKPIVKVIKTEGSPDVTITESEQDYNIRINKGANLIILRTPAKQTEFVNAFNHIYKGANLLITDVKENGKSIFAKNNEHKIKLGIGNALEISEISEEFRTDVITIMNYFSFKEIKIPEFVEEGK